MILEAKDEYLTPAIVAARLKVSIPTVYPCRRLRTQVLPVSSAEDAGQEGRARMRSSLRTGGNMTGLGGPTGPADTRPGRVRPRSR